MDLELSLFNDVAPTLSINDLHAQLPHDADLWHIESAAKWLERYKQQGGRLTRDLQSLNGLFRNFIHGRLAQNEDVPAHHLRLLLHPLQAMVLEHQQLLRVFGKDEPSYSHRVLSKLKILGRLQETRDVLQQLEFLLRRKCDVDSAAGRTSNQAMNRVNLILSHLISLNTHTCVPEIERIARQDPPMTAGQRAERWRHVWYSETSHAGLSHAGQIFRLLEELGDEQRPAWWPLAAYRAALVCWSSSVSSFSSSSFLSSSSPASSSSPCPSADAAGAGAGLSAGRTISGRDQPEVSINTLPTCDKAMHGYLHDHVGRPVLTLPDGTRIPAWEGNNGLDYCINLLGRNSTRLVRVTQAKLRLLAQRWRV